MGALAAMTVQRVSATTDLSEVGQWHSVSARKRRDEVRELRGTR
jgi:hypothetical protein